MRRFSYALLVSEAAQRICEALHADDSTERAARPGHVGALYSPADQEPRTLPMTIRYVLATLLVAAALPSLVLGATPAADPGFKVPREQLIATVKSVGFMPVSVVGIVPDADTVARRLESEVLAHMAPAGVELVPPEVMKEIEARARTAVGGLFDPLTGRQLPDKVRAYQQYNANEYRRDHPVDAWLRVRVVERLALIEQGAATWDGVSDSATGHTGFAGFMLSGGARGVVLALSLSVQLITVDGRNLYDSRGGLQVLEYVNGPAGNLNMVPVDPKSIMQDPARDERALGIALDPLARGKQAKPAPEPRVAPAASTKTSGSPGLSPDELRRRFHRIALAPLELGPIAKHEPAQARYADLVRSRLTELGFEVVPADEFSTRVVEEITSIGGVHDAFTGHIDAAKNRAVFAKVARAACEQHEVSAVVVPAVESRTASYRGELATWDGVQESAAKSKSGLAALFSPTEYGYVRSLSLVVRFIDVDGESQFEGRGGIQLAEHLEGERHVSVPEQELLADSAKDKRAVEIALNDLQPQVAKPPSSH